MPQGAIQIRASIGGDKLPGPYDLYQTLHDLAGGINASQGVITKLAQDVTALASQVGQYKDQTGALITNVLTIAGGGGSGGGGLTTVNVTPPITGDGSSGSPLAISVDGATIQISGGALALTDTAVTPGTYGGTTDVAAFTVDQQGRITAAANVPISFPPDTGITQLTGDVTAGPGSGSVVATLANSGVAAGSYGSATAVATFTVDAKGRLTAAATVAITGLLSGLTAGRVPYVTGATALADSTNFTWTNATPALGLFTTHSFLQEAVTSGFPAAAATELVVKNTLVGANVLSVRNLSASGYSAYTARTSGGDEVLAVGYGNGSVGGIFQDTNYIQSWSGTDAAADPKRFIISMDGNYGASGSGVRYYVRQSFETDGSIKFWEFLRSTVTQKVLVWMDGVNARVGIGNYGAAPENKLHIADGNIQIDNFANIPGALLIRTAGGVAGTPTQTAANTTIFALQGRGYNDAGAYTANMIAINGVAVVAPTTTDQESRIDIRVIPSGSTTLVTAMQISGASVLLPSGILLRFAGLTSSFPALKRSSTTIQTRLADDSAFAQFSALEFMNNRANFLMRTAVAWNNGAAAGAGTITNAPAAGNPTKWIPVDDNGTTRYVPAW